MERVRVGLVGVGGVGEGRVDQALASPEADVAAFCDVNEANLKAAAAKKPGTPTFTDAHALFASGTVDAVLLNVPHFLHSPLALKALECGLHVMVEKPMAIRISECDAMLAAAKQAGRILTVHHQRRITLRNVLPLFRENVLGRLVRATYVQNGVRNNAYYRTGAWRGKWKTEGGGVLINQCIHDIDAFLKMTGQASEVSARLVNLFHDHEVEDSCVAALRFPGGGTGSFSVNISSMSSSKLEEFEGEQAVLAFGKPTRLGRLPGRGVYDFFDAKDAEMFGKRPEIEWKEVPQAEPFAPGTLVRDFVQAVQGRRAPLVDAEGAREAVHFFNALVLSHFLERPVKLPLDPGEVDHVFEGLANGKWKLERTFRAP